MARAKRHFIPGYIWHITHRCHKREFLLKFARDRPRWLYWLYQARKRYGLTILNYMVTSNHYLLVADDGDREVIPKSIKLIAGKTGQEYNQIHSVWSCQRKKSWSAERSSCEAESKCDETRAVHSRRRN